jgi:3-phosphoshikimate 1-carboxyvinyltransferase
MALSLLLSVTGGAIDGAEAVRKSYPDFFTVLQSLGIEVDFDGMDP